MTEPAMGKDMQTTEGRASDGGIVRPSGDIAGSPATTALAVDQVSMEFDGRRVLRDVNLSVPAGTVHGLIGHNGSGKSTLVRILAGYYRPTAGNYWIAGERVPPGSPAQVKRLGLRFVHQDLGLIPEFTSLENFGIGGEYPRTRWRTIDWREQTRRMRGVFELLEQPMPPDRPVAELTAVQRSLVAIARAIGARPEESGTRFLFLDEPTTALEASEAQHLFAVVQRLAKAGIGTIFISHQLTEVLNLCSAVTVLRDGQVTGTLETKHATRALLVEEMLGKETAAVESSMQHHRQVGVRSPGEDRPPALAVRGLRSASLRGVDVDVAPGECVFVVGLAGSGREELVYALAGAVPAQTEQLEVAGAPVRSMSPSTARKLGVALVPGNRLPGSLVADFAMRENLTFASLETVTGALGAVRRPRETAAARSWVERLDIKPADIEFGSRFMSGGNKQKVVVAKWLSITPNAMLIDEPTAGVDVGAVTHLFATLRQFADAGGALLVSTSELGDALALADSIVVMSEGRVSRVLVRGEDEFSEQALLLAMVEGSPTESDHPAVPRP
jgi:ribose transport system ATP-binding protein